MSTDSILLVTALSLELINFVLETGSGRFMLGLKLQDLFFLDFGEERKFRLELEDLGEVGLVGLLDPRGVVVRGLLHLSGVVSRYLSDLSILISDYFAKLIDFSGVGSSNFRQFISMGAFQSICVVTGVFAEFTSDLVVI